MLIICWSIDESSCVEMTEAGAECLEVAPRQVGKKRAMGWFKPMGEALPKSQCHGPRKTPRKKNGGNPPLFQTQEAGHVWLLKFLGFWASKEFFGMMVDPAI